MDDSNKLAGERTPPARSLAENRALVARLTYSAGQETTIHLVYGWVLTAQVHVFLPYAVIVILFILWQRERTLRKSSIYREHQRVEELETQKDSNRTSSGLEE